MAEQSAAALSAAQKEQIRDRFLAVDTSNVADVLDEMGLYNQGLNAEFQSFIATSGKLAGWAYTIRGQMAPYEDTGDVLKMTACQGIGPGEISVWSGDGSGVCYFGELIAIGMKERGSVGALIDGGIRDVRWIAAQKFPVYARYRTPVQSIGRWKVTAYQQPVYIRGATSALVTVNPDDFILGDDDGCIVIPAPRITAVLERSEQLTHKEALIRRDLAEGMALEQALEKYGHV